MFSGFRKKEKAKTTKTTTGAKPTGGNANKNFGPTSDDGSITLLTAPSLKELNASEQPKMFLIHLRLCQERFNFEKMERLKEKEAKRLLLLGLVDYINNPATKLQEATFSDILSMVTGNIFRTLPPRGDFISDMEEEEPILESAWPHIQIVYEFLLRFIVNPSVDPKIAKRYISQTFILKLLNLFDSEDPRERDYLKTILHRIYGKFMALRAFIRKAISNVFFCSIYLGDHHNGIAELLEILGSIINGFALPLKLEHQLFLIQGLIPLHKIPSLNMFHQQLEYCITQFVEKDSKMAEPVILGLLKYWPNSNSPKQLQFLHELEEIFECTQSVEFRNVTVPLFKQIAECLSSQHFQVAERTLMLWNSELLFSLITQNRAKILPLVFGILKKNTESHWNLTVQSLSQNVLQSFQEMDRALFEEVAKNYDARVENNASNKRERFNKWNTIAASIESQ